MHYYIITKKRLFDTKLRYDDLMIIFTILLIAVIAWNFSIPEATSIEDVVVAIILSLLSVKLKNI
jgi:hypothetical protein